MKIVGVNGYKIRATAAFMSWAPGTLTGTKDPKPPIPIENGAVYRNTTIPVVSLGAVPTSSFRDRAPVFFYSHGGEGGIPPETPPKSIAFVTLAPRPATADVRFQAVISHSFVETDASPRPVIVSGQPPQSAFPAFRAITLHNTPDDRASPAPVTVLAAPIAARATPAPFVLRSNAEDAAAAPSPQPVNVQASAARLMVRPPVVVRGSAPEVTADASARPLVVIAALTARFTVPPATVVRGPPEVVADPSGRPVLVTAQAIATALTAARALLKPIVLRIASDLIVEPPPVVSPFVIGGRELPGERARMRRRKRDPEEPDFDAIRHAELQADVSKIIRDEEERQRKAVRTEAEQRMESLRKNLRELRDLD